MRHLLFIVCIGILVCFTSCRDDFKFEPSSGQLEFSKDTVYLDTVFTNIGSSTYTLKVYNHSNKDINIPSLRLGEGENSKYRLMVDGMPGKVFNNVELLAKDSLFIFIETTINYSEYTNPQSNYLYTDKIEFDSGSNYQKVDLVTLVQDAIFLYPQKYPDGTIETLPIGDGSTQIQGFYLDDDELDWNRQKPYVIYGYAGVKSGKTLNIDAGSRIHFHANSGIIVANNASLKVNGSLSPEDPNQPLKNEVIFEGDRLEPSFSETPGQWGTIWLTQGSTANVFDYATIKNATVGILMDANDGTSNPTLTIRNTQIYNSSNIGLYAKTGHVVGENVVINKAGQSALVCSLGGKYHFKQSTFANYWSTSFRQTPTVLIDNFYTLNNQIVSFPLEQAQFDNCIIYGNNNLELVLRKDNSTALFNYQFNNCLIRFNDFSGQFATNLLYKFDTDPAHYNNCLISKTGNVLDPNFLNAAKNKLIIGNNSAANGKGANGIGVPLDIRGVTRTSPPDLGAYQHVTF